MQAMGNCYVRTVSPVCYLRGQETLMITRKWEKPCVIAEKLEVGVG